MANTYLVSTVKPWNLAAFERWRPKLTGNWLAVCDRADLSEAVVGTLNPRYIFFPHWSWIVPKEILSIAECVCFHMTDVPYGRGGSPLQNLIARGKKSTVVSALRMVPELDAGPVYLKCDLDLSGSAESVFERAAELIFHMADEIARNEPEPVPQEGEPVVFPRRTPAESVLPGEGSLEAVYDHVRMLDAETYPRAYMNHGDFRIEFRNASLRDDAVECEVTIKQGGGNADE